MNQSGSICRVDFPGLSSRPSLTSRQTLELPQGRLAAPHAMVDHLAQRQRLVGQAGPPALQADLKQAAHKAPRALRDIDHVRGQRQALELQGADVGLRAGREDGRDESSKGKATREGGDTAPSPSRESGT